MSVRPATCSWDAVAGLALDRLGKACCSNNKTILLKVLGDRVLALSPGNPCTWMSSDKL